MKITKKIVHFVMLSVLSVILSSTVSALPANQNQLSLKMGIPKRNGETAFSTMVTWRKNGENLHRTNGLVFIDGVDTKKPTSDVEIVRKIKKAINAGVAIQSPHDRGAIAKSGKDKAEILVSNKAGFNLAHVTVRDYTNQELQYSIPGKSFKSVSVRVAIDFVYSSAVEYVDGFSSGIEQKTAGGFIKVTFDNNAPIEIKTDGKSAREIEKELAKAIGANAQFSTTPLYPNFVELRSKNYKSFDGGEVQLSGLNSKSITIDVNDSGLGVLTKFNFPDEDKPADIVGNVQYIAGFFIACVLGCLFYMSKKKNVGVEKHG